MPPINDTSLVRLLPFGGMPGALLLFLLLLLLLLLPSLLLLGLCAMFPASRTTRKKTPSRR